MDEQQSFPQFLSPQHAFAVLSFPHPSLQQPAALLSAFMQDLASLPPQQDFISLPAQHEAVSFASLFSGRWQLAPFAILEQHDGLALSAGAEFWDESEEEVWLEVCAHDTTVRARTRANIFDFMILDLQMNEFRCASPGSQKSTISCGKLRRVGRKLRCAEQYYAGTGKAKGRRRSPLRRRCDH